MLYPPLAQATLATRVGEAARRRHGFHRQVFASGRMHITVVPPRPGAKMLAPYDVSLARAAASVRFEPFDVRFDHTRGFRKPDGYCFVLCSDPDSRRRLRAFDTLLNRALRAEGIRSLRSGPMQPHLTLIYGTHSCPQPEPIDPIAWRVDRFLLIRSLRGLGRHIVEGEWRASPGGPPA